MLIFCGGSQNAEQAGGCFFMKKEKPIELRVDCFFYYLAYSGENRDWSAVITITWITIFEQGYHLSWFPILLGKQFWSKDSLINFRSTGAIISAESFSSLALVQPYSLTGLQTTKLGKDKIRRYMMQNKTLVSSWIKTNVGGVTTFEISGKFLSNSRNMLI